ncbi:hypothetical protein SELMODRAFT_431705 [Selaginella moellendorffii]|uniref:DDE Tnp4 domain-containing protein n=1 Tax=Selaginella moellendorffii TaxID=88036 RepID=D8TDI1_SELML|nr:hypothetical protein SELMODRAFT_431705 [Selaginella moellendorffii]
MLLIDLVREKHLAKIEGGGGDTALESHLSPFCFSVSLHIADDKSPGLQVLPEEEDRELEVRRAVIGRRFCIGLWWVKPRNVTTWSKFSLEYYDVGRWKRKLQMERRTFFTICGMLESKIRKQDTGWKSAVPVDVRLGVTLYKLFKNTDYLDLADKFGIGESTAHEIVMDTTVAIVKCLRYKIHFPSTAKEVRAVTAGFRQVTGHVHDTRVFRNSTLKNKIVARELLTLPAVLAYDDRIKPYLVGDKGCLDQKQRIQPKYLPNIIKSCCILHNFLIDVRETDLRVEIQAWRKEVKRLKDQDLFVDYGDPEQAEGEPREELHSPEDVKECSNALFLSANPRVFLTEKSKSRIGKSTM